VARKVPNGLGALTIVYPDAIQVDGRPWHIRYSTGEPHLCFAFPKPMPFRLAKRTFPVRTIPSDPAPATLSTVLMIVEGPPLNPLTSDAADREFCAKWGLEVPAGFQFPLVGCPLWSPPYGEVYRACKLQAATAPGTSIPVHDMTLGEEVAIKVVRHQNDNVPGAELGWWFENGQRYGSKLIHHEVPARAALTTEHLSPFFREQSSRGRNENLVNEIETMAFVAGAVNEAVDGDSQRLSGASAESNLSYLRSRFLPHEEVALSPDNLFIVTPYAPFGSLTSYISRERARNPKLSEICVKHVLRHMLQGLCFLHERGLAHQDISLENAVLQAPDSAAELRRRSREFLSEADFLRLEVVLIDMGHMGIHQRETDISLQHSLLNASNITINTATTCESTTSDPAGPSGGVGISLDCSAVHSRAGSMDSSSGMEVSVAAVETATPQPNRKFRMRPMPKYPLGKRQYQSPELCEVRNPLPYAPGREYCGMCLDIWQLGVLAIYMLTGRPPYEQFDSPSSEGGSMLRKELTWFMAIEEGQLRNRPVTYRDANDQVTVQPLHTKISAPGMALLEKLLQFNPEDRISAKAALEDPWFST
jgi:serine/threonine protein kinase